MQAINDALAQQIIHASISGGPAAAGHFLHPAAGSVNVARLRGMTRFSPGSAIQRASSRIVSLFAAPEPTPPACCTVA